MWFTQSPPEEERYRLATIKEVTVYTFKRRFEIRRAHDINLLKHHHRGDRHTVRQGGKKTQKL